MTCGWAVSEFSAFRMKVASASNATGEKRTAARGSLGCLVWFVRHVLDNNHPGIKPVHSARHNGVVIEIRINAESKTKNRKKTKPKHGVQTLTYVASPSVRQSHHLVDRPQIHVRIAPDRRVQVFPPRI